MKYFYIKLIFFQLFLYLFSLNVSAQVEKVTFQHKSFWSKTEVTQIWDSKFGVGLDFIFRSNNELNQGSIFENWHRFSYRPWLHYQYGSTLRFSFSPIALFETQEYFAKESDFLREPYTELRTTFQVLHHHKYMGEKLTHTFRHWYEIRYRNPFEEENNFTFTRYRMRYRLRYLFNKDYYSQNHVFYGYVSNEIMVSFGQNIVYNMFSQNRIQAAVGYRIHPSTRIELRYMNRYRSRPSGFEYDNTNAIFIGLFVDQLSALFGKDIRPVRFFD